MRLTVAILVSAAIGGCTATQAPEVETWLVRPPTPKPAAPSPDALAIQLAPIDVAAHIQGVTVIRDDGKVDHLVYHRWAAPVGAMVTSWVRERLQASALVTAVLGPRDGGLERSTLILEVRRFEFIEAADGSSVAEVELWGTLSWPRGRPDGIKMRVLRGLRGRAPVDSATGPALPAAMTAALVQAVEALTAEVESAFQSTGR